MAENLSVESMVPEKQWCSREQVAQHFQIGLRTVGNLMRRKILPFCKSANLVRFELGDCDRSFEKFNFGSQIEPTKEAQSPIRNWRTKEQIASHLRISLRSTTNLMRKRVLSYVKIGNLVRIDLGQTDRAIEQLRSRCVFDRGGRV
jgi:hypothetical protein